jgi:hypothetical protein
MRPVLNDLQDLHKLYGGSAEMYWQGALPGIFFGTHPQLGADARLDVSSMKTEIEKYFNGLQRFMSGAGIVPQNIAPQVVDPRSQIDVHIEAICIQLDIPKRIFMGSERGELSSGQDAGKWDRNIVGRQSRLNSRLVIPFIDRLIDLGCLPKPKSKYKASWKSLSEVSEESKMAIASAKASILAQFVSGELESVIDRSDFMVKILGMDIDEVEEIISKQTEAEEDSLLDEEDSLLDELQDESVIDVEEDIIDKEEEYLQ